MSAPLDRERLKVMKRADLQKMCMQYGFRGNLKTDDMIDLLSGSKAAPPRRSPPPSRLRPPSTRIASRSSAASRLRGASSSSMIIHDTDEEDEGPNTLYKLGVGRPAAQGGKGARVATRSTSMAQKGKRVRGSRSVKPTEAAIQEEEVPQAGPSGTSHEPPSVNPPAATTFDISYPMPDPLASAMANLTELPVSRMEIPEQLQMYITNLVPADHNNLSDQLRLLRAEVDTLRSQAALVPQLQSEVQVLRQAMSNLSLGSAIDQPSEKSLGKARASEERCGPPTTRGSFASEATAVQDPPGPSQPTLGKRSRDSEESDSPEGSRVSQSGHDNAGRRQNRPSKKRAKLSKPEESRPGPSTSDQGGSNAAGSGPALPRGDAFTVFQGPEEPAEAYPDPLPAMVSLTDLFPIAPAEGQVTPPTGGGAIPRPPGADENAPNQMHGNFDFDFTESLFNPVTSTPFNMNLPMFTYPEPPTSPSPMAPSGGFVERAGGRIERNDLFHPFRRFTPAASQGRTPSRSEPPVDASSTTPRRVPSGRTVNPADLMHTSTVDADEDTSASFPPSGTTVAANGTELVGGLPRRTVSSTEVGMQLGMGSASQLPPDTPGAQMKRTMYGTELDADTRFGDFGVEGVASGFWAGLGRQG
ncbi:uncharacterized protein BXZ73DRAFT_87389 [Epithele typhae]|uniref:uncharacterized protein n=1 Tax=Epithele typhae TaxID=378194 RepID=UPI00200872FA|nr:uncharacterized protein BXZ73DRAFT_87389 [Epithele typhae]KAH9944504.1 hypothetical protein BXZ73DRAFT_87389 [Epithele typhae]